MEGESGTWRVLYAEGDSSVRDRVAAELAGCGPLSVEPVGTLEEVRVALDGDWVVDCVLTGGTLEATDWPAVVELVRDHDRDLPVVLYTDEPDPEVASEAIHAGVTEYLPRSHEEDGKLAERVRAAAADFDRIRNLRDQSNRYEEIMETLPLSMFFKDEEARFIDASDKLLRDLDVDPIGKTDAELWGDPDDPTGHRTYRDDLEVIESGEPIVGKEERHRVEEGNIWVRTSKFPWVEDGEIRGMLGTSRNITGQKSKEEELRRKSQRLEQFASFVSHDLRNPVNIAQGYLDRAKETGDEAAMDEVEDALERMETLIDDLLTTVRQGNETEEWIDFPTFVDRVWTATEIESGNLNVEIPEGTTIAAVGGQFRQVLNNLFRNADDHGGEDVTVTVGLLDNGFYVEDDGPGIDPEVRDSVFEYGHADDGTGIGLTIAREIAAAHGWEVTLTESEVGGARLEFRGCVMQQGEYATVEESGEVPIDEQTEIGDPAQRGHAERKDEGQTWVVAGGGEDVWQDVEEHFYAYGTVGGDVQITARLTDLEDVDEYSKAGIMVRDWPGEGSSLAYVGMTPEHGAESIYRSFPGNKIQTEEHPEVDGPPRWFRLEWINNTVGFRTSTNGEDWVTLNRQPIAGRDPLSVGLAVCSKNPDQTAKAVFEDVRVVQLEPTESDE